MSRRTDALVFGLSVLGFVALFYALAIALSCVAIGVDEYFCHYACM